MYVFILIHIHINYKNYKNFVCLYIQAMSFEDGYG